MADATAAPQPNPNTPNTLTYYHGGPLFTLADLTTNISLSNLISALTSPVPKSQPSELLNHPSPALAPPFHFQPILPQSLEPRSLSPHAIRDSDLRALLSCDAALFVYDGAELDAGTVVEYMVAKFADIPSVILRTDFRGGGDQGPLKGGEGEGDPGKKADSWNLMSSFWPRTTTVTVDSMAVYKSALASAMESLSSMSSKVTAGEESSISEVNALCAEAMRRHVAEKVVRAMEEVVRMPPRMPKHLREGVWQWMSSMVGWMEGDLEAEKEEMRVILGKKVEKGML